MKTKPKNNLMIVARATDMQSLAEVPTIIQVAPFGKWKGYTADDGSLVEFEVNKELAAKAVEYHQSMKKRFPTRDIVIDYEHQTTDGGEAPAAGWIFSDIFLGDDGIYARVKEWTAKAAEYIRNKEYRYLSPVMVYNGPDKETGETVPLRLVNVALTNEPFIDNIIPITAKDNKSATIIYLTDSISQPTQGDSTMDDLLQSLRYFLSLPLTSTAEEIATELGKLIQRIKDAGASSEATVTAKALMDSFTSVVAKYKLVMTELGMKEETPVDDVKAFVLKHNSVLQELGVKTTDSLDSIKQVIVSAKGAPQQFELKDYVKKTEHEALQLQLKDRDAKEIIAKHVNRGACAPYEVEDLTNDVKAGKLELKDLNDRLTKRADYSIVPLQEIQAKNVVPSRSALSSETLEVAGKLNVSKEDIEKYGKL